LTDFVTIPERPAIIKGDAQPVAAGEACVRLRSGRKSCWFGMPDIPHLLILRLLRSRTQASPAATGRVMAGE